MLLILLSIFSLLAACSPSPQKAAMPNSIPVAETATERSSTASLEGYGLVAGSANKRDVDAAKQAPPEPRLEAVAIAEPGGPGPLMDSPAEAMGRRVLSTAFVRIGPDGHLTVELRDGAVLVLRDVVMRRKDYCGTRIPGNPARTKYCGGYAEVAAARPGGAPASDPPPYSAASGPAKPARGPATGK